MPWRYRIILAAGLHDDGRTQGTESARAQIQQRLTTLAADLFTRAKVAEAERELLDTGDGWLASIDPQASRKALLATVITGLHGWLVGYNTGKADDAQARIRLAIHGGYVPDPLDGDEVNRACQLRDASALRGCLEATTQPLAVLASIAVYHGIITRTSPPIAALDLADWHLLPLGSSDGALEGWAHVPGDPDAPQRALETAAWQRL